MGRSYQAFQGSHARDAAKIVIIREGEEYPEGTPLHPGDKVVVPGHAALTHPSRLPDTTAASVPMQRLRATEVALE